MEADLAEVFGSGNIIRESEQNSRKVVQVQSFTSLRHGCEIRLDSGARVLRYFTFPETIGKFSAIVQLSFLGRTHGRALLATAIDQAMVKRVETGVAGVSASPGYEGILKTLAACSSQSNTFCLEPLHSVSQSVNTKLQESIPGHHYFSRSPESITSSTHWCYGLLVCCSTTS